MGLRGAAWLKAANPLSETHKRSNIIYHTVDVRGRKHFYKGSAFIRTIVATKKRPGHSNNFLFLTG